MTRLRWQPLTTLALSVVGLGVATYLTVTHFDKHALACVSNATFNCEAVEDLLLEEELARFYELERVLRRLYGEIGSLLPGRTFSSALLSLSEP